MHTTIDYRDDRRVARDVVDGYCQLIEQRVRSGGVPYLVTMMFRRLPGNNVVVLARMFDDAEWVYRTFLPRTVRRPFSPRSAGQLSILIVAPDLPVGKRDKLLRDVVLNDGLHLHACWSCRPLLGCGYPPMSIFGGISRSTCVTVVPLTASRYGRSWTGSTASPSMR